MCSIRLHSLGTCSTYSFVSLHLSIQTLNCLCRWSEVITHVPCGGNVINPAGRLLIGSTLAEIDGDRDEDGNILGFAGPRSLHDGCRTISATGEMTFDIFDIGVLEDTGALEGVILHEMGHVIGVGCAKQRRGNVGSTVASVGTYSRSTSTFSKSPQHQGTISSGSVRVIETPNL